MTFLLKIDLSIGGGEMFLFIFLMDVDVFLS